MLVADRAHVLQHMAFIKNCIIQFQPSKETAIIRAADCTIIPVAKENELFQIVPFRAQSLLEHNVDFQIIFLINYVYFLFKFMCDTKGHVLSCSGCQEQGQLLYLLNHLTGLSIISLFTFRIALMREH